MKVPALSVQGALALLTVLGDFVVIAVYVIQERSMDVVIVAIISSSLSLVLGFYFGHSNGSTSALAVAATALANRTNPGDAISELAANAPVR